MVALEGRSNERKERTAEKDNLPLLWGYNSPPGVKVFKLQRPSLCILFGVRMKFPIKVTVPFMLPEKSAVATPWFIFVKKGHFSKGLWEHEMVHIAQFKRIGYFRYMWRYLTDIEFRVEMESEAYGPNVSRAWIRHYYKSPF